MADALLTRPHLIGVGRRRPLEPAPLLADGIMPHTTWRPASGEPRPAPEQAPAHRAAGRLPGPAASEDLQ